jgi:hypothetical protein
MGYPGALDAKLAAPMPASITLHPALISGLPSSRGSNLPAWQLELQCDVTKGINLNVISG